MFNGTRSRKVLARLAYCHRKTCSFATSMREPLAWVVLHNLNRLPVTEQADYSLFYSVLERESILLASKLAALSTSSSVVQRPSVRRKAPSARSRDIPIAINTGDGSVLPS